MYPVWHLCGTTALAPWAHIKDTKASFTYTDLFRCLTGVHITHSSTDASTLVTHVHAKVQCFPFRKSCVKPFGVRDPDFARTESVWTTDCVTALRRKASKFTKRAKSTIGDRSHISLC